MISTRSDGDQRNHAVNTLQPAPAGAQSDAPASSHSTSTAAQASLSTLFPVPCPYSMRGASLGNTGSGKAALPLEGASAPPTPAHSCAGKLQRRPDANHQPARRNAKIRAKSPPKRGTFRRRPDGDNGTVPVTTALPGAALPLKGLCSPHLALSLIHISEPTRPY